MTSPSSAPLHIRPFRPGEHVACEAILRSVPQWFGIESATLMYVEQTKHLPTFICEQRSQPVGFVSLKQHFDGSADIFVIAVAAGMHRHGVGRALVEHAESWARERACRILFVKTMGPSKPNREYAETLKFYLAMGFTPLEEFQGVWPGLPCLVLAKPIRA